MTPSLAGFRAPCRGSLSLSVFAFTAVGRVQISESPKKFGERGAIPRDVVAEILPALA